MLRVIARAAFLATIVAAAGSARADIVDQSYPDPPYHPAMINQFGINLDNAIYAHNLSNIGQTFTPTLNSVSFFTFYLQDINPGNSSGASFYVQILGPDFTTVLGTSQTASVPDSLGIPPQGGVFPLDGGAVKFDFSAAVALTSGTTYEAEIFKVSGDSFWAVGQTPGGYAGGSYTSDSGDDLYFAEGIRTQSVPEPSSLVLLGLAGAAGATGCVWRRRRAAG